MTMNANAAKYLTKWQIFFILTGVVIDIGILSVPNDVVEIANQDGWISVAIGMLYPLYITFAAAAISKLRPKEDILDITKSCFGKLLGTILYLIMALVFLGYLIFTISGVVNFLRAYIVDFISPLRFFSIFLLLSGYCAVKEERILSEVSKIVLFIAGGILIIPLYAARYGSITNIQPVFEAGLYKIGLASTKTIYSYTGIEVLFLILPLAKSYKDIKSAGIMTSLCCCFFYLYITAAGICYLSPEILKKTMWSTVYIVESIRLPIINSFRLVVLVIWNLVVLKAAAINYHYCAQVIVKAFNIKNSFKIFVLIYPIAIILSMFLDNETIRRSIVNMLVPYITGYGVLYVTLVLIAIGLKRGRTNE